ncbi:MAG: 30S ribosomal protein S27e [Candidatus Aenigmarchaeota archaeon]|nr:30S ribosomal protein S27e [Candidatus Aenigmarchaeota archaeon]NIP40730.1 30S ribosomal protein S27e [Candidatus Aenigmarchaeota archaeon]NIQ18536.1 30S ribosomal protein S27e [Candidatus Aenigmarchaeota archaeon]NIS73435.1 30S ribosomal protein S27e [Candidatus Aenigmarchaeota archaeon]
MASKFLRVKCRKCKNEQVVFERPSSSIKCLVCEEVLAEPTGGKAKIKTDVISKV